MELSSQSIEGSEGLTRASSSEYSVSSGDSSACQHCGTVPNGVVLKKCANCRTVAYCSKDCQVNAWKDHKVFCKTKNPVHFERSYRQRISWFQKLERTEILDALLESFKLRLLDEYSIFKLYLTKREVSRKLLRYLEAARSVVLTNNKVTKTDLVNLKNEVLVGPQLASLLDSMGIRKPSVRFADDVLIESPDSSQIQHQNSSNSDSARMESISLSPVGFSRPESDLRSLHEAVCGPIIVTAKVEEQSSLSYNII